MLFFLLWTLPRGSGAAPPDYVVEISVYRLDCSRAPEDLVQEALAGAAELLKTRCGLLLKVTRQETIKAKEEWCDLSWDLKKRLRLCDQITQPYRRQEPGRLGLFLVNKTGDSGLSWAQVEDGKGRKRGKRTGCGLELERKDLADFGSIFFTDLAWESARVHDQGPDGAERPWMKILLAHEIFHALTQLNHPTRQKTGNLMADGLARMGTDITPEQCECLKQSPYVRRKAN